jgi:arylsulfatase A
MKAEAILTSVENNAAGKDYPEGKVIQTPRHEKWMQMDEYKPQKHTGRIDGTDRSSMRMAIAKYWAHPRTIGTILLFAALSATSVLAAPRPNVIVIMADDLGAEGLGCYGSTIYTTPNLDRMAEQGARFMNAYATPLCTPTRVMIMSGLYPNRTGYKALMGKAPGCRMPAEIKTFGHYFRDAGYETAIAGKWQLGKFDEFPGQTVEHGLDEYCMWSWVYEGTKRSRYYAPHIHTDGQIIQGAEEDYGPDFYSKFVLDFIDRNKDDPFFIYFPMALVHSPFVNPPQLEELARSKFTADLPDSTKAFGHMITYMDDIVGRIMKRLQDHGIAKHTLVIFTADNGTHKAITSKLDDMDVPGGKGTLTEAGTRVPLIAWWPGAIAPAVRDEFFCLVDILPTIAAITDIELTAEVDGFDLSHILLGEKGIDREHVFIIWKTGAFVRENRFRLNSNGKTSPDGKLYEIPVTSNQERYSEKVTTEHEKERHRLKAILEAYMAIPQEYHVATRATSEGGRRTEK